MATRCLSEFYLNKLGTMLNPVNFCQFAKYQVNNRLL